MKIELVPAYKFRQRHHQAPSTDLHPGEIPAHRSSNQTRGKFGAHAAFTSSAAIRLSSSRDLLLFSGNPMSLMYAAVHRASYFARASCSGVISLGRVSPLLGSPVCEMSLHRRWCHRGGPPLRITSPTEPRALQWHHFRLRRFNLPSFKSPQL